MSETKTEAQTKNLEEQIALLHKELEVKQKALEAQQETQHPRELLHEVVGEKIEAIKNTPNMPSPPLPPRPPRKSEEDEWKLQAPRYQAKPSYELEALASLLAPFQKMLEEKTLEETIVGVVKTDNPALVDAFHDWLVEKAYSHLVETGKLERVE